MTFEVAFTYFGRAIPKMRAGRNGKRSFTPKRNAAFEAKIRAISAVEMARAGLHATPDAVLLELAFEREIPKSWTKAKQLQMRGMPIVGRPDVDNLQKAIMDAMNGVVYEDDAQVADVQLSRRWGQTDCVRVRISLAQGDGFLAEAA